MGKPLPADPLYVDERQVAERVGMSVEEWRATAIVLERSGLPRVDAIFGRRYWPAVRAFFDRRHGLSHAPPPASVDGLENWDETGGRRRGGQGSRPSRYSS